MIEIYLEVELVFFKNVIGERKSKVCIRVDGGYDEGSVRKFNFGVYSNY